MTDVGVWFRPVPGKGMGLIATRNIKQVILDLTFYQKSSSKTAFHFQNSFLSLYFFWRCGGFLVGLQNTEAKGPGFESGNSHSGKTLRTSRFTVYTVKSRVR